MRSPRVPTWRGALAAALACLAGSGGAAAGASQPPFASGDDAANIPHDTRGRWVVQRWVARRTGRLDRLYVYAKVEGATNCVGRGRPGYAAGTSGRLLATTHRVLPGGTPDMRTTLARSEFVPCGNDRGDTVTLTMRLAVRAGQEFATVVRNVDPRPGANYFSSNFLYQARGVRGANGRNERRASATDVFYGLDPREMVGYSTDSGRTWRLPGGPYGGRRGAAFLPTYIQEYADGATAGQPYYWSSPAIGPVAMVFRRVPVPWTIREFGAYVDRASSGEVVLFVDGAARARATLRGDGFVRATIPAVRVSRGQTVLVTTTAGPGGLALRRMEVDALWADTIGLGTGYRHYLRGDPIKAATVYPLPAYWATGR